MSRSARLSFGGVVPFSTTALTLFQSNPATQIQRQHRFNDNTRALMESYGKLYGKGAGKISCLSNTSAKLPTFGATSCRTKPRHGDIVLADQHAELSALWEAILNVEGYFGYN